MRPWQKVVWLLFADEDGRFWNSKRGRPAEGSERATVFRTAAPHLTSPPQSLSHFIPNPFAVHYIIVRVSTRRSRTSKPRTDPKRVSDCRIKCIQHNNNNNNTHGGGWETHPAVRTCAVDCLCGMPYLRRVSSTNSVQYYNNNVLDKLRDLPGYVEGEKISVVM